MVYFANRENIRLLLLKDFNKLLDKNYKNIKELLYNPPLFKDEVILRNKIDDNFHSLNTIIIVEDIDKMAKYELFIDYKLYEDVKENLIFLG